MATSRTSTKTKSTAMSLLGNIGVKPATTSKSKTPLVQVLDQKQLKALAAVVKAKNKHAEAASALKVAEGGFRDTARDHYEKRCQSDGTLHTSVKLVGQIVQGDETKSLSLNYTQTRRCAKMLEDQATDPLRSVFGAEYDNLFGPQRTIGIDTSVLSDDQIVAVVEAMQTALGDNFDAAVTVESLLVPKEAFFGKRVLDPKIHKQARRAAADGYAVPFAASFKL